MVKQAGEWLRLRDQRVPVGPFLEGAFALPPHGMESPGLQSGSEFGYVMAEERK